MKIKQFNTVDACNTPVKCSLRHPSGPMIGEIIRDEEGNTIDVWVYGIKSTIARNALRARDRKYGKVESLSEEEASKAGAEFLAAITQGWSKNLEDDNGPMQFSLEAAAALYLSEDWITQQVYSFAINMANYSPKK